MIRLLLTVLVSLLLLWGLFIVALAVARPKGIDLRASLRILPDTVRLIRRLAADRTTPRSVRVWLWLLLGYLLMPIDVVPDFIPVLGYADDAVIVALVLRHVVRRSGPEVVRRLWPGTPDGLAVLAQLCHIDFPDQSPHVE